MLTARAIVGSVIRRPRSKNLLTCTSDSIEFRPDSFKKSMHGAKSGTKNTFLRN